MADNANDMFLGVAPTPSEYLKGLAARAVDLKTEIEEFEAILALRKRDLNDIFQVQMVDAMRSSGFTELSLPSGHKFKLSPMASGTLPKPENDEDIEGAQRREAAISWLVANGHDGLIKSEVTVAFARTDHNRAVDTQQSLIEQGLPAVLESGVHAQTLQAFGREALKNGDDVPFAVLGLNVGQYVKMTAPKEGGK